MRRSRKINFKFHAIAISAICLLIVLLYSIIGPEPGQDVGAEPLARGDRYIQIYSATWGENCNPAIDKAIEQRANEFIAAGAKAAPMPERVKTNNVLPVISSRCDGRLICNVPLSSETLQVEPLESCYKRLTLSYRCFSMDRLWNVDLAQGSLLALDCQSAADATRK